MNEGEKKELREICNREFKRSLNDEQLLLLWTLIKIAPGEWWWKWSNLHQYLVVALEGLDNHSKSDPRLRTWGNGGF